MSWTMGILALLVIVATALPIVRTHAWWVRGFDFPRLQLAVIAAMLLLAWPWLGVAGATGYVLAAALMLALALQVWRIWPYTRLHPVQTQWAAEPHTPGLRVLVANVLQDNRDGAALVQQVQQHRPDLFLAVETDAWWASVLSAVETGLPYTVKVVQDNTYGMLLYSRYPLHQVRVRYLIEDSVPSIVAVMEIPESEPVTVFCLHPRPPRPAQDTTDRDAELVQVGREARQCRGPVLVAGDLNDVAWSHTTRLFQRVSRLLDPRVGRGMYSTFNANWPFIRFPLDHVFHSEHFRLRLLNRLGPVGSDHFPALFELTCESRAAAQQSTPDADSRDWKEAENIRGDADDGGGREQGSSR